jgi:hypothetical protein
MLCNHFNVDPTCKLERHANGQDRVPLQRRDARRISRLPEMQVRISTALYRTKTTN